MQYTNQEYRIGIFKESDFRSGKENLSLILALFAKWGLVFARWGAFSANFFCHARCLSSLLQTVCLRSVLFTVIQTYLHVPPPHSAPAPAPVPKTTAASPLVHPPPETQQPPTAVDPVISSWPLVNPAPPAPLSSCNKPCQCVQNTKLHGLFFARWGLLVASPALLSNITASINQTSIMCEVDGIS